jgi:hypothetical protein
MVAVGAAHQQLVTGVSVWRATAGGTPWSIQLRIVCAVTWNCSAT